MRRAGALVASMLAVLLAGAALAACSGGHKLAKGEGRLTVTGTAEVAHPGKDFKPAATRTVLHAGDQVRLETGGGRVDLGGGGTLELLAPARFRFATSPFLQAGDMLVEPAARALTVSTDDAQVVVDNGATRLSRTLALTVTTYRGRSMVTSPGSEPLAIRAPRRATVAGRGLLPETADAIAYLPAAADSWDRRFLADLYAVGEQLQSSADGFAAQLADAQGHTPGFYRTLLPALANVRELDGLLNPALAPGDDLVGAAITVRGTAGTFADRWREVFAFRDPGEAPHANVNWGFVALDAGVDDVSLVTADVEQAIGRAPTKFVPLSTGGALEVAGPATTTPGTAGGVTSTTAAPRSGPTTGPGGPGPTSTTTEPTAPVTTPVTTPATLPPVTTPTAPGVTVPAPVTGTPVDSVVDPLVDAINSLLPPPGRLTVP